MHPDEFPFTDEGNSDPKIVIVRRLCFGMAELIERYPEAAVLVCRKVGEAVAEVETIDRVRTARSRDLDAEHRRRAAERGQG